MTNLNMTHKEVDGADYAILPKAEWTPQNVRDQWQRCDWAIDAACAEDDGELRRHYKQLQQQIEHKMTPEQFSLMADDFDEVPDMYKKVLAKVKAQEGKSNK